MIATIDDLPPIVHGKAVLVKAEQYLPISATSNTPNILI
ncbi:hypothetical protein Mmol_1111 [Methylotenera mobilis JLW8]|uniref:Uncharacterized protein n=1 Tax=Methylotenera mobilis (strain JLW8 / ATCC BAA-1282 / DSM 17540) TaxID=583345 RepID=C6WVS0_METML|nr:hypothetical protein Mmol_1111 [Methylotenera mobilis JLW8]